MQVKNVRELTAFAILQVGQARFALAHNLPLLAQQMGIPQADLQN